MPAITPDLLERARGSLLGAAIGDAFGMPLEGLPRRPIDCQVRDLHPGRLPKGHFTRHTGAMLTLAEALLSERLPDARELAASLTALEHAARRPAGQRLPWLGRLLGRRQGSTAQAKPTIADAGVLVRCIPIALVSVGDRNACMDLARDLIRLTHEHPDCAAGGAFVACMLWNLLHGMPPRRAMHEALAACGDLSDGLAATIREASSRRHDHVANGDELPSLLESVLRGFIITDSYAEAVARVSSLGDNAPIAGALAGALAGAAYRSGGIPAHWRAQVHGVWPSHSGKSWRENELSALAERLVESWGTDISKAGYILSTSMTIPL